MKKSIKRCLALIAVFALTSVSVFSIGTVNSKAVECDDSDTELIAAENVTEEIEGIEDVESVCELMADPEPEPIVTFNIQEGGTAQYMLGDSGVWMDPASIYSLENGTIVYLKATPAEGKKLDSNETQNMVEIMDSEHKITQSYLNLDALIEGTASFTYAEGNTYFVKISFENNGSNPGPGPDPGSGPESAVTFNIGEGGTAQYMLGDSGVWMDPASIDSLENGTIVYLKATPAEGKKLDSHESQNMVEAKDSDNNRTPSYLNLDALKEGTASFTYVEGNTYFVRISFENDNSGPGPDPGPSKASLNWNCMTREDEDRVSCVQYKVNASGDWQTLTPEGLSLNEGDNITVRVIFNKPEDETTWYEVIDPSLKYEDKNSEQVSFDYIYEDGSAIAPKEFAEGLMNEEGYTFTFKPEEDSKNTDGTSLLSAEDAHMRFQFSTKISFPVEDIAEVFVFMQILDDEGDMGYGCYVENEGEIFFKDNLYIDELSFSFNGNPYGGQGDPYRLNYGFRNDGKGLNSIGEPINGGEIIKAYYDTKYKGNNGIQEVEPINFGYFEVGARSSEGSVPNTFSIKDELIDEIYIVPGDISGGAVFENAEPLTPMADGSYSTELDNQNHCFSIFIRRHAPLTRNISWKYTASGMGDDVLVDHGKIFIEKVERDGETLLSGIQKNEDGTVILKEFDTPGYDFDILNSEEVVGNWNTTSSGGDINLQKNDIVTIMLIPTYGYQIKSAQLNGMNLTPNEEVSSFTFTLGGNVHIAGSFVKEEDVTDVSNARAISDANITDGEAAADSGNLSLTVADNDSYEKTQEAIDKAIEGTDETDAYTVASLDMTLKNIVSKGNGDYWTSNITSFEDDINISLELDEGEVARGQSVAVIRDHEGTLEKLEAEYDETTGTLSFPTNQFSTYSIVKYGTPLLKDFRVSFDCGELYDGPAIDPIDYEKGETYGKYGSLPKPEMTGYVFMGWKNPDGTIVSDFDKVTASVTLTAHWTSKATAATPVAKIPSGTALKIGDTVSFECSTPGVTMYYTTDATVGESLSNDDIDNEKVSKYFTENLKITDELIGGKEKTSVDFYVIAVKDGYNTSEKLKVTYPINRDPDWGDITEDIRDSYGYTKMDDIPKGLWTYGIETFTYTGKAITQPNLKVFFNNKLLTLNSDYTVKYANNIKAGNNKAVVTITSKGSYSGSLQKTFTINPFDLTSLDTEGNPLANFTADKVVVKYNGKEQSISNKVTAVVAGKTITLKKGTDFDNYNCDGVLKEAGSYTVYINGINNYTGRLEFTEVITNNTLLSKLSYAVKDNDYTVGGTLPASITVTDKSVKPAKTFTMDDGLKRAGSRDEAIELCDAEDAEYSIVYFLTGNENAGTATVTFMGVPANGYEGEISKSYKIKGTAISSMVVSGIEASYIYNGFAYSDTADAENKINVVVTPKATKTNPAPVPLTKGNDYTLSFENNVNAGKATIVVAGKGAYTGSVKKTFKITAYDVIKDPSECLEISTIGDSTGNIVYKKSGVKPLPTVKNTKDGGNVTTLENNKDYTLSYSNNSAVNRKSGDEWENAKKIPTVTIKFKGNYSGSIKAYFGISQKEMGPDDEISITASDVNYTGKAGACKPTITLVDADGKKLSAGTDYDKNIVYRYTEETLITRVEKKVKKTYVVPADTVVDTKNDIIPKGVCLKAEVKGIKNYIGEKEVFFKCIEPLANFSKATVTINKQTYNGEPVTLNKSDITVTINKVILKPTDYVITGYSGNDKKGTAKVTLQGVGAYGGSKTVSFTIEAAK